MKRYALFSGIRHYPIGGWQDLNGLFDSVNEAVACFDPKYDLGPLGQLDRLDWAHIIDLHTGDVVAHWQKDCYWVYPVTL